MQNDTMQNEPMPSDSKKSDNRMRENRKRLVAIGFGLCASVTLARGVAWEDLSGGGPYVPGQEYRLSMTGVVGTVADDHVHVTRVTPDSPVEGRVVPGDRLIRVQGRPLADNLPNTIRVQMMRLWRENNGHLALTFERPEAEPREDSTFTIRLHLPAPPGTVQHFGPLGIHGSIQEGHVEVERLLEGSPADGPLGVGDRILKVGGNPVQGDLYGLFTDAIEAAETAERGGELTLKVLRPESETGPEQVLELTVVLPVIGTRSPDSPLQCPKTDTLITRAADALLASGDTGRLNIGLLGLLATGEERHITHVGEQLRRADFARPDLELSLSAPMVSWPWSYRLVTLCEYYLLTGDRYVLPAIRTYAQTIAAGQDVAGLWNHRMADPAANRGELNGRLYGYGAINQTSAVLWIGLILAERCGVDEPAVRTAIEKTRAVYGNWAGKGALPYGNHAAMEHLLTNNGTSGSVAVGFALLGDADAARFYATLSAASHGDVLTGHTGPFFNYLWSGLGANVLGPEVLAEYEARVRWLRTMTRVWDGRFQYMEARGGVFDYSRLSATGANLLNLSAGRRALQITGKGMDRALWLEGDAARAVVERPQPDEETPLEALSSLLGHPLPPVRLEAARTLAAREAELGAAVLDLLAQGRREQRIGALHALRHMEVPAAAGPLLSIVLDAGDDPWIRELAVGTLAGMDAARPHAPELLRLLVRETPDDPFRNLDLALGRALVQLLEPDPYAHDLDWDLFHEAVLTLLDHPHMWARSSGMTLIRNLPLDEFHRVADKVVHVIRDEDLTYTSYHADGHRQAGLELLNRLNIREVLELAVTTLNEPTGRPGPRKRNRMNLMRSFGGEAQSVIPLMEEVLGDEAAPLVEAIRSAPVARTMIPLDVARQRAIHTE